MPYIKNSIHFQRNNIYSRYPDKKFCQFQSTNPKKVQIQVPTTQKKWKLGMASKNNFALKIGKKYTPQPKIKITQKKETKVSLINRIPAEGD